MNTQTKKEESDNRSTMTITKKGYEFTLIEGKDRGFHNLPSPAFDGHRNWALKACKKLRNEL